ncbi:MAG: prepilin peptidase [Alphaproteobacteria bacterium]|nr:prepilin peptidase [Alphaproteobacteria bacterium]
MDPAPIALPLLIALAAGLIGLAVGSFLGVLVLRLPHRQPVAMARSQCPHCGHVLRPGELIPVASWLIQRRRCRACGATLSAFYPVMELAAAAVAIGAAVFLPWPESIFACLAGWALLVAVGLAVGLADRL